MATTEALTLDGVTIVGGNFDMLEFDVTPPKPRVEWATAADSEYAALVRQPLYENRIIKVRLRVRQQASMNAALDQVGVIQDKLRKASGALPDGIALTWTPANSTRTVTFDVLEGDITELPVSLDGQGLSWGLQSRPVFNVEMTCKPYWRGSEVTTSSASSSTPFVTLEVASVPGDVPALGRLIVTDPASQNRRHVEWGLENRAYNSGTSLLVDSDNMTTTGFVGVQNTGPATPYDPNASGNNVITITPLPVPQVMCSTGNLSHVGTFRVKARVYTPTADTTMRIGYQVGDGPLLWNKWVTTPGGAQWSELDLDTITIPPVVSGTQRWVGRIEAYSPTAAPVATPFIYLDYLVLVPAGEGYGLARNPVTFEPITSVSARDEFDQTAGSLSGKVMPVGGSWSGAGDADDAAIDTATKTLIRGMASDANLQTGRYMIAGSTNYTNVLVQADITRNELGGTVTAGKFIYQGIMARYVDTSNWVMAVMATEQIAGPTAYSVRLMISLAGVWAYLGLAQVGSPVTALRLVIDAGGRYFLWAYKIGNPPSAPLFYGTHTQLATGGTLATGKPGLYDANTTNQNPTRFYDNFIVSAAALPPALYSGRTLEFRHNDTIRQDSTGTYTGRPSSYRGTRFVVPPGTSRVLVKARRDDIVQFGDNNVTDNTTVQVAYTPRGVVVPR